MTAMTMMNAKTEESKWMEDNGDLLDHAHDDDDDDQQQQQQQQQAIPLRWRRLTKLLEENGWDVNRITGSHHIFTKPGHRSIPLAFHGGTVTKRYAKLVLRQAGILGEDYGDGDGEVVTKYEEKRDDHESRLVTIHDHDDHHSTMIPKPKCLTETTEYDVAALKEQFEKKLKLNTAEQERRVHVIETIQEAIATGEYANALSLIATESIDIDSTSTKDLNFVSDVIFFQITAQTELALAHRPFNCKEQQNAILETLRTCIKLMQANSERRADIGHLVSKLLERVLEFYVEQASIAMDALLDESISKHELHEQVGNNKERRAEDEDEEEVHDEPRSDCNPKDVILGCLQFIVEIYQSLQKQPFGQERSMEIVKRIGLDQFVEPSLLRMIEFIKVFAFDSAQKAADTILFVTKALCHRLRDKSKKGPILISSELAIGVARYVKRLFSAYKFGESNMKFWSRYEADPSKEVDVTVTEALAFSDMFLEVLEGDHEEILKAKQVRVVEFIANTWFDPVIVLCIAAKTLQEQSDSKKLALVDHDSLTRKSILMMNRFQRLTTIYNIIYDYLVDSLDMKKYNHAMSQLVMAQHALDSSIVKLLDGKEGSSISIYRTSVHLQACLSHGNPKLLYCDQTSGLESQLLCCDGCASGGADKTQTETSGFGLQETTANSTLTREERAAYDELKRLLVIDGIGSNRLRNSKLRNFLEPPEALAFSLIEELFKLNRKEVPAALVRKHFLILDKRTCKRHLRINAAKRMSKAIAKLLAGALDQKDALSKMLQSRKSAFNVMMEKLESCVLKRRGLPDRLNTIFNKKATSEEEYENFRHYGHFLQQWSQKDITEIWHALLTLEDAGEVATRFVHQFLPGGFPVIKSLSNPTWTSTSLFDNPKTVNDLNERDSVRMALIEACILVSILNAINERNL